MKRDDATHASAGAEAAAAGTEERSEKDWGLSPAKPRMGIAAKIGLVVVVALAAAGGFIVVQKLRNQTTEIASTDPAVQAAAAKESDAAATKDTPADPKTAGTPGAAPSGAAKDDLDPFAETKTSKPGEEVANQTEPPVRAIPDLDAPVESSATSGAVSEHPPAAKPATQAAAKTVAADSELDIDAPTSGDDLKRADAAPVLAAPGSPARFAAAENARTLDVDTDPPAIAAPGAVTRPDGSAGNAGTETLSEKIDGYQVAADHADAATRQAGSTEAAPATEDRLAGYVAEELTSNRAVGRTIVKRSDQAAAAQINAGPLAAPLAAPQATPVPMATSADSTPILPASKGPAQLQGKIEVAAVEPSPQQILPKAQPVPQKQPPAVPNEQFVPIPENANTTIIQRRAPASANLRLTPIPKEIKEPATGSGVATNPDGEVYTIAPNDNFWKISKKQYGTGRYFMALTRHNQNVISDPLHMKPGVQVLTPTREVLESRYPELIEKAIATSQPGTAPDGLVPVAGSKAAASEDASSDESPSGYFMSETGEPMYRVGHDDTLTGISQRHLGRASRWVEILEKNRDVLKSPETLKIGTVIRLPGDASRLSLVRPAEERR